MSTKFKKPKTLVKVTWGDAWNSSGWIGKNYHNDHGPAIVNSVGYVMVHDKKGIQIGHGLADDGSFLGSAFIPSGMIFKVTTLAR